MPVFLQRVVMPSRQTTVAAEFLAGILGLDPGPAWGPTRPVQMANGVTIGFEEALDAGQQHYAFAVSREEFDAILERVKLADIDYYADARPGPPGTIAVLVDGRRFCFGTPDGHWIEILTFAAPQANPVTSAREPDHDCAD